MSRKIIGITVGTPMSPQAILDRLENIGGGGSNDPVTKDLILSVLGYTPADQKDIDRLSKEISDLKASLNGNEVAY
jgi:hypothetical protein